MSRAGTTSQPLTRVIPRGSALPPRAVAASRSPLIMVRKLLICESAAQVSWAWRGRLCCDAGRQLTLSAEALTRRR